MNSLQLYRRFEDLPDNVRQFFNEVGRNCDFSLTLAWYRHLAETTRNAQQELRIYCLQRDALPSLLLPMYATHSGCWPWRTRRLSALANYYSALTGPLLQAGAGGIAKTIAAIVKERPHWDIIDLHPLAPESSSFIELEQALRHAGMAVQRYFCFGNWYLDVAGRSYQTYLASLPSKLRNTLARKTQQLQTTGRLHMDIITGGAELEAGIASYLAVYGASWKKPEPFPDFIPGLIRLCAQQNSLRLGVARIDGIPAAAQIWIVHNKVAAIYKLAYDTRFASLSVGSILTSTLMEHVIEVDRVREVDYLMGDDTYKQDWMSHRRERWGLRACNLHTARGIMAALGHQGRHFMRRLQKSVTLPRPQKQLVADMLRRHIVRLNRSKKMDADDMMKDLSNNHFFHKKTGPIPTGKLKIKTACVSRGRDEKNTCNNKNS